MLPFLLTLLAGPALADDTDKAVICLKVTRGVDTQLFLAGEELVDSGRGLQRRGCVAVRPGYHQLTVVRSFQKGTVGDAMRSAVEPGTMMRASGALVQHEDFHEFRLQPGETAWLALHTRTTGTSFHDSSGFGLPENKLADWHQAEVVEE